MRSAWVLPLQKGLEGTFKKILQGLYPRPLYQWTTARIAHVLKRRLRVSPSESQRKAYVPTSGLIQSFLSLNSSDMNYIQCDECKYRLVCNGEPLTSGSTGSCDHRVISNTPIFPKIKTPPDERYDDIWNW